jgi:dUTP pyrophosphatase
MKIKFKKRNAKVVTPEYAKEGDAGMDLTAIERKRSGNWLFPLYTYHTGISLELPKSHYVLLTPRSSLSKKLMWMANHVGIVDSGYRGELIFKFRSIFGIAPYKVGERIGQMVLTKRNIMDLVETTDLETSERGEGGFGHTGR